MTPGVSTAAPFFTVPAWQEGAFRASVRRRFRATISAVMKRAIVLFLIVLCLAAGGLPASGAEVPPSGRHYAPSREADILHLAIDVTPDFRQRTIAGTVAIRFKPIAQPLEQLRLDAADLAVQWIRATAKVAAWQATDAQVIVTFDPPIRPDTEASVTIHYTAAPQRGLYFRTPEMGYKAEDTHLFTQGETIEARHWFPCYDAPNEKFTSEVTCRVPEGMVVLSNGRRVSSEKDPATGLVAVRWLQDKPHVSYLIALAAGRFKKVEDKYRAIPLAFYTPASQIAQAQNSFEGTRDMMGFFEQEIGVPYPWARYDQVCVDDFVTGGMENTSLTIMTDGTLHTADYEDLHDSQGLVAHELAHQWFGDLVTCKDWANIWLNEGFATYYELLYDGYANGRESFLYRSYESAKHIIAQPNQTTPIVRRDYRSPDDMFGYLAYPKGAWVLHMLRSQLGEDLYRRCIKTYLERHQYGLVTTEDLNAVIEELSGRSFDQFFDQWVYHAAQPDLAVSYAWDEKTRLAKVTVQQNQKLSDAVLLFNFPLPIRFKSKSGTVDRQITVKEKAEDFYLSLPWMPEIVRIDPDLTVLAKVNFNPPAAMLQAQMADQDDMLGRLLAIEQLGARADRTAAPKLKEILNTDRFWGVRVAAAKGLRAINTDESFDALLASLKQSDARVRRQVVVDLGGFHRDAACATLLKVVQDEKNPEIQAEAIRGLGAYRKPEVRETLLRQLNSDSYRSVRAGAAIGAIRVQDEPSFLEPLRERLQKSKAVFPSEVFASGLETLAWLARNEEKKDGLCEWLTSYVNDKKQRIQLAALNALGTLGDAKAVAVLEKFSDSARQNPQRGAAERALATLRDARKPPAELGALRKEVTDLKTENRQLRKDVDDLKKKLEALVAPPPVPKAVPPRKPGKPDRR
jgi:aminopeptidase N